jgi:hypothetical protein
LASLQAIDDRELADLEVKKHKLKNAEAKLRMRSMSGAEISTEQNKKALPIKSNMKQYLKGKSEER